VAALIRRQSLAGFNQLVEELGANVTEVLQACQLNEDLLTGSDGFVRYHDYIVLLETASEVLGCHDFGVRLAAKQNIDILGPLALAARQAKTLGEALNWVVKYIHFHAQGLQVSLTKVPASDELLLTVAITLSPLPKANQTIELTLALGCQFAQFLSGGRCHIKTVLLPHHYPHVTWHAKNAFRCPVTGDHPVAAIVLDQRDWEMPLVGQQHHLANAAMNFLKQHCDTQSMSLTEQVEVLVKAMLMFELCTNEMIASALDLSVRQLHRKLALEETSFIKIKNAVRRLLAQHYLSQKTLSVAWIAELLGYQEQSAFTKACQGWFGCSARQVRYNLMAR